MAIETQATADVPEGFKLTEIGPLPEGWEVVPLRDVVKKPQQVDPRRRTGWLFRYVDVSSVSNESLRIQSSVEYPAEDAPSRARKVIRTRDIIFATVRPYLRRVAIVPQELDGHICSTAFCVIRTAPEVADSAFVFYAVTTDHFVARVSEHQRGTGYPAVTDKDVLAEAIPLPPLGEQRAIARVLSTIQRAIEATERVIAAARELKRSLMSYLFTYGPVPITEAERVRLKETEIVPVPEHWEVGPLGSFVTLQRGFDLPGKNRKLGTIPVVSSSGITGFHSEAKVRGPGVVMGRYGTLGHVYYIGEDFWPLNTALFVKRFNGNDPMFVALLLAMLDVRAFSDKTSIPGINRNDLHPITVGMPPLEEQGKIATGLALVDRKIEAEEKRKGALKELFRTVLHLLMTGQVRVKDWHEREAKEVA